MKKHPCFLYIFVLFFLQQSVYAQQNKTIQLAAADFKQRLDTGTTKIIIDVRTPEEFATGYINGASNINVNDKNFKDHVSLLDKNTPVYVYCKGGLRSATAATALQELGFTTVYDLKGGIMAWTNQELPLAAGKTIADTYTTDQFDALLAGNNKVLVDFYADWCLPCKKMAPGLQKLQQVYAGKVTVIRINVDEAKALAKKLKLEELPVLITYADGKEVKRLTGYQTDAAMKKMIKAF